MLFAELFYSWCDLAVVCIRHARKQVVLNLVVDTSENESVHGAVGLEILAILDLELKPVVAFVVILNRYIIGVVVAYKIRLVSEIATMWESDDHMPMS